MKPLDRIESTAWSQIVPPPRLNVSDWLDANRIVDRGYPSPFPGPWRTGRTPYLRQPLNDFVDPAVETLVFLFSSQIGKTEALLGMLMYAYGVDPGPGMFALPTLDLAGAMSTDRLASALRSCAILRVGGQKTRKTDDAVYHKRINGFPLTLVGANSPAGLSSRPVRYAWCDEIDRWPATTAEGDPLSLIIQRTAAYRRRKLILTSTPTIKGASRIEDYFARSDRRELWAPCLRCGVMFVPEWSNVRWESGLPETACLECPECGGEMADNERAIMFEQAQWLSTIRDKDGHNPKPDPSPIFSGIRGYRTWAIVSPWTRLSEMVVGFLAAKQRPETLQSWINLTRGESWESPSERVESAGLLSRRETYDTEVPRGAVILTAGIDTQDDRLESLVLGWGVKEEVWVISRDTVYGDPQRAETWKELDDLILCRQWPMENDQTTRIQCALVDALGHRTSAVYSALVPRQHRRVFASIGRDGGDSSGQLVSVAKVLPTSQGNVIRYIVDASQAKAVIYARLKIAESSGPGVIHFPNSVGESFFNELTSEQLVTERNKYNVPSKRWAMRPGVQRNESLDCFGMALAAFRIICPNEARFAELVSRMVTMPAAPNAQRPRPAQRTRNWSPGV